MFKISVHEAFEERSLKSHQHARFYPLTSRKVVLQPAQIPLTRPNRPMNGDVDILNGKERWTHRMQQQGHLEGPHAASGVRVGQGRRVSPVRFLFPHQISVRVQETLPNVHVSEKRDAMSSTENKETKTEGRGNRIRWAWCGRVSRVH
jgi:hypothetical protein